MRHEYRKVARITDELITFFLEHQATEIELNIKNLDDREVIRIEAAPVEGVEEVVDLLQRELSYPREAELEEYYWELAGECDYSTEIAVIGGMTDKASIDYDEHCVSVELTRMKKG